MKKRTWKQVVLSIPESHHELLTGSLVALGFGGFVQEETRLTGFIPSRAWTHAVEVKFRNLLSRFRKEFPQLEGRYMLRTVREKNWNAAWERSAGIIEATGRIIIKPSWKKLRASDKKKIVLHIDPKMAFGTGHHETTRLSLTLLERCCYQGARVLDVGTGTGVLAIAAVKLGAHSAIGIDIDEWSIANAKENVYRNHAGRTVRVRKGDVSSLPDKKFDVVVANIDYPTIVKNLAKLVRPVKHGGTLILSGLLTQDLNPLLDALKHQSVVPVEVLSENEWAALALVKSDGK
ncbi:MAG: 50S ribosomal protein L11 methyltransferase [Ignavibacteriae bacterium]|nr:50S ribosomal protein L11 methyltransferase [Ignavibacteriota bacterium]